MTTIRSFADTSAVSIAYAMHGAANAAEFDINTLRYLPYTQEGFQLAKANQMSTAIRQSRRQSGSKNTKGTATGSVGLEFGMAPFINDMLKAAMMSNWVEGAPNESYMVDGETKNYMVVEKRIRNVVDGTLHNFFERYYGTLANEVTIEVNDGLVNMTVNTMSVFGDTAKASAGAEYNAGGLASTYVAPDSYEIADASNNVKNTILRDSEGNVLPVVFSNLTISITNNVREQPAVGSEFAAGMGMGKVNAQVTGTIYYYDDSILDAHLRNKNVSAELTIETKEGELTFILPNAKAEAPNANAAGENQDYTQTLTLNGEEGVVSLGGEEVVCTLAIKRKLST